MSSAKTPFRFVHSRDLPELLATLGVSLLVSTYQAGRLAVFRRRDDQISLVLRAFDRVMGVAISRDRLAVGTRYQIWFLENDPRLAALLDPCKSYDACYCPRRSHVTGEIRIHEIAWGQDPAGLAAADSERLMDELWIVNTRFSCLCTLDASSSFVPQWCPPFVSELAAEDRCHLNGLAMREGRPGFVTVIAESNAPQGWRAHCEGGGCAIDVRSGQTVVRGLSMPHSPRWYRDRLWLLDSGNGRLLSADPDTGSVTPVADVPGYARGLALRGDYAFIGLSKIRPGSRLDSIPLANRRDQLCCGVWVCDLRSGRSFGVVEFQGAVTEVFDVQLLPQHRFPALIGLSKDTVQRAYSLPNRPERISKP
jgi:uncharacterized protein (TIGR03032 family)